MKPGPNFKMSKANKFVLSNILDPHKRGAIKRSLIDAQLTAESKIKVERNKGSAGNRTTNGTSSVAE